MNLPALTEARLVIEALCGHQGSFVDGSTRPLDGMERHPMGVATGFNKGGGKTYESWCPGGSRRDANLFTPCPNCEGSGEEYRSDPRATEREHLEGLRIVPLPCPSCWGSGTVLNPSALEAAAEQAARFYANSAEWRTIAAAAVRAFLDHEETR